MSGGRARVLFAVPVTAPFTIGAAANQIQCSRKKWCVHIKKLKPRVWAFGRVSEAEHRTTRGYCTHNGVGSHTRVQKKTCFALVCLFVCCADVLLVGCDGLVGLALSCKAKQVGPLVGLPQLNCDRFIRQLQSSPVPFRFTLVRLTQKDPSSYDTYRTHTESSLEKTRNE